MTIIGQGIPQIIGMLGLASGVANSRVVRAAVIGIEGNAYFEAAHAIGSPSWRTLLRHVWPNITAPIIIIYSITIGWAIIAEASLSFLGFGLPPDVPSWGTMLSREGRQYMEMAPRLAMWPGVALTLVVYCLNMVGDALRDLLDPRLRGGGGSLAGGVGTRAAERATKALQKLERKGRPSTSPVSRPCPTVSLTARRTCWSPPSIHDYRFGQVPHVLPCAEDVDRLLGVQPELRRRIEGSRQSDGQLRTD